MCLDRGMRSLGALVGFIICLMKIFTDLNSGTYRVVQYCKNIAQKQENVIFDSKSTWRA